MFIKDIVVASVCGDGGRKKMYIILKSIEVRCVCLKIFIKIKVSNCDYVIC